MDRPSATGDSSSLQRNIIIVCTAALLARLMWKFLNRVNVEDGQGEPGIQEVAKQEDQEQLVNLDVPREPNVTPKSPRVQRSFSSQTKEFVNISNYNANVSEIKEDTSYQIESPFLKLRKINSNNLQGNYCFV